MGSQSVPDQQRLPGRHTPTLDTPLPEPASPPAPHRSFVVAQGPGPGNEFWDGSPAGTGPSFLSVQAADPSSPFQLGVMPRAARKGFGTGAGGQGKLSWPGRHMKLTGQGTNVLEALG